MEKNEEYHDPDYPGASVRVKEEAPSLDEEEKIERIKTIIQREFKNEIDVRENEVMLADQRMATARRMLHRLRCALVSQYYRDKRLQQPEHEEPSSILRSGQRRLHPSVRKLLGKTTADMEEIFRPLATRNKRIDYSAMLQPRNYTISADCTRSLRPGETEPEPEPSKPTKTPRHREPRPEKVLTLDEVTRNKMKHRYRIIIGNTSKYAPAASAVDRSTHKWLLYVRGPSGHDAARLLRAVVVTLHHSYAPHHIVHIDAPPYHISRRGWGEFPARVELHFKLPERNRPASVEHTIKLDRHYTGLQTLGAETLVDVWLYSTPDMLECEYKEEHELPLPEPTITPKEEPVELPPEVPIEVPPEVPPVTKQEPAEPEPAPEPTEDSWLDFFTTNTKLNVDEMIIKPEKKQEKHIENQMDIAHTLDHIEEPQDVKPDIFELEKSIRMEEEKINWSMLDKTIENPSETIPTEILSQPASPKKRIMKYLDPKTGKIYYLEMDRNLDLSKVQEIVINSKGNMKTAKLSPVKQVNGVKKVKKGVSLLKPEVKNLLSNKEKHKKSFTHIQNDHCYLGVNWARSVSFSAAEKNEVIVKKENNLYECLCAAVSGFACVRVAVNYLLKKVPIVSEMARDPDFRRWFPFTVDSDERFWKMDFAKRRNKEWSRAKLINTILTEHFRTAEPIWRTKQILIYSRLHGYQPVRRESLHTDWSWDEPSEDPETISVFKPEEFNQALTDTVDVSDDEDVEVVGEVSSQVEVKREEPAVLVVLGVEREEERLGFLFIERMCADIGLELRNEDIGNGYSYRVEVKREEPAGLAVLPVERDEERLGFMFIERMCADIGLELRNEDIGNGYSYSAVHAVMLSAVKSFAEELVRNSNAAALLETRAHTHTDQPPSVWTGWSSGITVLPRSVAAGAARSRLAMITNRECGARRQGMDEAI